MVAFCQMPTMDQVIFLIRPKSSTTALIASLVVFKGISFIIGDFSLSGLVSFGEV